MTGRHRCQHGQVCTNVPGSYTCTCPRGYRAGDSSQPCVGQSSAVFH